MPRNVQRHHARSEMIKRNVQFIHQHEGEWFGQIKRKHDNGTESRQVVKLDSTGPTWFSVRENLLSSLELPIRGIHETPRRSA